MPPEAAMGGASNGDGPNPINVGGMRFRVTKVDETANKDSNENSNNHGTQRVGDSIPLQLLSVVSGYPCWYSSPKKHYFSYTIFLLNLLY